MHERIRQLHKASLYAVIAVAFLCIVAGGSLSIPFLGFFTAAAAGSWYVDGAGWVDESHNRWWNALILAFLAFSLFQVFLLGADYLTTSIRFVLVLTLIKLMSRTSERDELQLYALGFLMIAAATAVNEDVTYGILFGLFVLTGTFSLALFHLKSELSKRETTGPLWSIPFDRRYMTVLAGMSVVIFASSVGIFFGFPRIGLGYFAKNSRSGMSVGGFSDSVELGSHGVVRNNPTVAMRVEFPNGRPPNFETLHWRTITFDEYDGNGWSKTLKHREHGLPSDRGTYDFDYPFEHRIEERRPRRPPREMNIYLEPLGSDLLPTLWPTAELEFTLSRDKSLPGNPRTGRIEADPYGDLSHTIPSDIGIPYKIKRLRRPSPNALRQVTDTIDPEKSPLTKRFLQLPDDMERIAELARQVTEGAETPYAKAEALERHLQTNYQYTTNLPKLENDNPVEGFLFDAKRGHCEYYATSMTLMLRTLGIPARMVNGFLGGKWNNIGGYLTVRQGDAHSWVELYIRGYGWVPMDPTPAGSGGGEASAMQWFRDSYDAMRMAWMQWVIEYDLDTQVDLVRDALRALDNQNWGPSGGSQTGSTDDSSGGANINWRPIFLWGGLLLFGLGAGLAARRIDPRDEKLKLAVSTAFWTGLAWCWIALFEGANTQSTLIGLGTGLGGAATGLVAAFFRKRSEAAPVTRIFYRIERAAGRHGFERRDDEPAAAFLERLAAANPKAARQLDLVRHRYLESRFGGRELDADTRRNLERLAKDIAGKLG